MRRKTSNAWDGTYSAIFPFRDKDASAKTNPHAERNSFVRKLYEQLRKQAPGRGKMDICQEIAQSMKLSRARVYCILIEEAPHRDRINDI